jgi:hypothetical protein
VRRSGCIQGGGVDFTEATAAEAVKNGTTPWNWYLKQVQFFDFTEATAAEAVKNGTTPWNWYLKKVQFFAYTQTMLAPDSIHL